MASVNIPSRDTIPLTVSIPVRLLGVVLAGSALDTRVTAKPQRQSAVLQKICSARRACRAQGYPEHGKCKIKQRVLRSRSRWSSKILARVGTKKFFAAPD
jgi:hypothetical protein